VAGVSGSTWKYFDRKAYALYLEGVKQLGLEPSESYGVGRVKGGTKSLFSLPVRFSVYDGLFGAVPLYSVGWAGLGDRPFFTAAYPKLAARVVTSMYLSSDRWKDAADVYVDPSRWVRPDLVQQGRRWVTDQIKGHRGFSGRSKGYDLPEPIPLSQVVFEEFGVDPLSSASDFVYTEQDIEQILSDGWYPKHVFRNVMSLGGRETDWRGVRVLVVREDFVPKVPFTLLPFDRYAVDAIRGLYDFVNKVWEDPDVLDDVSSFVVYRRNDLYRDSVSLPVVLPDFGVPWGYLLFFMTWYVLSRFHHGVYNVHAQSSVLADRVESALATYALLPAVAPYKPHATLFPYMVFRAAGQRNYFFKRESPVRYAESYGDLGLVSAWRYIQPHPAAVLLDRTSRDRAAVQTLKNWLLSLARNWVYGFGYIVKRDGDYFFYFGDPLTGYSPNAVLGYTYDRLDYEFFWFNYHSVPFLEFMRKFMFLIFEMWRRYGERVVGRYYVRGGKVDLDALFGLSGVAFRDFPEDLLFYEDPSQFRRVPFHHVFNMAMSIFPAVMYADVLPFRVYHYLTTLYHWHVMHALPNVHSMKNPETGEYYRDVSDLKRLYQVLGWGPRITYNGVSKAYFGERRRRFSGEFSALGEDVAYSVWNSWYLPGIVLMRFPFYDAMSLEFQVEFFQNLRAIPNWSIFDATGGDRAIAFFDDSTTYFIPYGRLPVYFQRGEGASPVSLLHYGYDEHLLLWVAKAFSGIAFKEYLAEDLLRALSAARGPGAVRRLRRYLRGRAKDLFDRYLSELLPRRGKGVLKDGDGGGSSSEPSSLNSRDPQ